MEEKTHEQKEKEKQAEAKAAVLTHEGPGPKGKPAPKVKDRVHHTDPETAKKIAESRKVLDHPLAVGQQLFESPEGEIIVGEEGRGQVWSRTTNGGKGGWINPMRDNPEHAEHQATHPATHPETYSEDQKRHQEEQKAVQKPH